jgi:hypothetical protein
MWRRVRAQLIAIMIWHLACLAMMFFYGRVIRHLVAAAYTAWFGDVQASYGTFERFATYVGILAITSPSTLVSLLLFDRLSHRPVIWKRSVPAFCGWELAVVAILICSYEIAFPYMVNQLGWALFGPPEEIYSFRNLMLHRIIAWLICTTPVAWMALWGYSKFDASIQFSLQNLFVAMTIIAVLLGIAVWLNS